MKNFFLIPLCFLLLSCDAKNPDVSVDLTNSFSEVKPTVQNTSEASLEERNHNVELVHPKLNLRVYCDYIRKKSLCFFEGNIDNKYLLHDISAVESQNISKLTINKSHIDSAKTFPSEWKEVSDSYVKVLMVSEIYQNGHKNIVEEPLIIYFDSGISTR